MQVTVVYVSAKILIFEQITTGYELIDQNGLVVYVSAKILIFEQITTILQESRK